MPGTDVYEPEEKELTPAALNAAEQDAGEPDDDNSEVSDAGSSDKKPSLYNANTDGEGRFANVKGRVGKLAKNKLLVGGVISGSSVIVILVMLLILIAGSLKIPNLSAHIVGYQFTRIGRQMAKNSRIMTAEQVGLASASDARWAKVTERYSSVRGKTYGPMVDKINGYRPEKVYKKMQSTGKIDFKYEPRKTFFNGKVKLGSKLTALVLDGETIPVNSSKWNKLVHPVKGFSGSVEFSRTLNNSVTNALPSTNFVVRGFVARNFARSAGLRYQWYNPKIYANKTEAQSRVIVEEESVKRINGEERPVGSVVEKVRSAADESQTSKTDCLANKACSEKLIAGGGTTSEIESAIKKSFTQSTSEKVIAFANPLSVFIPVCIIYDGSIDSVSGQTLIDRKSSAAMKSFMAVSSAADQQKFGDVNAEGVGAMNWKVGNISKSNAELRASGVKPDTRQGDQPQASATGEYTSIADSLPPPLAGIIYAAAGHICPFLSDPKVGVGLGLTTIIASGLTGGAPVAAGESAIKAYITKLVSTVFSKKALRNAGGQTVAIIGLTLLAQNVVHNKTAAIDTALSTGDDFTNTSDAGANLYANQVSRQHYGRPLTCGEVQQLSGADAAYQTAQAAQKSTFDRYIALDNPDSLVTHVGLAVSRTGSDGFVNRLFKNAAQMFNPLGAGGIFKPRAVFAAADCSGALDYGIVQWGMGPNEDALIDTDPSYKPLENQRVFSERDYCSKWSSTHGCLERAFLNDQAFLGQYNACFGYDSGGQVDPSATMGWLLARRLNDKFSPVLKRTKEGDIQNTGPNLKADLAVVQNGNETITTINGIFVDTYQAYCSAADIGINNSFQIPGPGNDAIGDFIFRYRLEKNYEFTLDQLLNVQNAGEKASAS